MKKTLLALILLQTFLLQGADFPQGSPHFFTSVPAVMQAAEKNGKPTILIFSASWCGPCQIMKNEVYPSSEIRPFQDKFNWTYLDIDDFANSQLANSIQVVTIPHIVFLNKEGTAIIDDLQGATTPKSFARKLTTVLQKTDRAKTVR